LLLSHNNASLAHWNAQIEYGIWADSPI